MVQVYEEPPTGAQGGGSSGEWSFKEAIAKGIAGTIGILTALIVDYIQKGNDSALLYATRLINAATLSQFHVNAVPAYIYIAVLIVGGFALVYIFEPTNKRNAFYAGAGVLGFLATFSPIAQQTLQIPAPTELPTLDSILSATESTPEMSVEPAAPAPATPGDGSGTQGFNGAYGAVVVPAAYTPFDAGSSLVLADTQSIPILVVIKIPGDKGDAMPGMRVWLHDSLTKRTVVLGAGGQFARTPTGLAVVYRTDITTSPQDGILAKLAVRVEADGFQITTTDVTVAKGSALPARINVNLVPSNSPLALQRLQYPYRW